MGRAFKVGVSFVLCLLSATPGYAQVAAQAASPPAAPASQPIIGFVSSFEITRIARSAGFDPLAPPLREGTTYVLRATDYRGILMRVVIDARTGAIRDATRIVPGPGRYGQYAGLPAPYDPMEFDAPVMMPSEAEIAAPPLRPLPPAHTLSHSGILVSPPLPRPRPAVLTSHVNSTASTAAAPAPVAPPPAKTAPAAVEPLND